ncbi:hypothetical protein SpCBS45565_g07723 [Spizellomyces sp. 'palustris']|nr:hypothetical protein SpCBS45565_g07723 [Spizellomyces sp. 'palustris']
MVSSESDNLYPDSHNDQGHSLPGNGTGGGGGGGGGGKFHKPIPNPLHLPNDILHSAPHGQHSNSMMASHSAYSSQTASAQSSPLLTPTTPTQPTHAMFSIGTTPIHTSFTHATHHSQNNNHHQQHHHQQGVNGTDSSYSSSYVNGTNGINGHGEHAHAPPTSSPSTPSSTPRSSMSINDLCNTVDDGMVRANQEGPYYMTDPDVQMAAEALGGLRHGDMGQAMRQPNQEHFMQRVSNIPLVNKSINQISTAYEATKNASRVVKYSAESVETGVKTITKPVFDKLEPALAPLDRFACTQLDKLERSFPSIMGSNSLPPSQDMDDMSDGSREYRSRPRSLSTSSVSSISSVDLLQPPNVPLLTRDGPRSPQVANMSSPSSPSSVSIPGPPLTNALVPPTSPGGFRSEEGPVTTAPHIDRKPRSRWHQVVAGVGANLSGLMLSDETMKGLKYCLQWLQYATNHIDRQIALLRDYLARAGGAVASYLSGVATSSSASQPTPPLSPQANDMTVATSGTDIFAIVASIKREVVETLRRVVDVIGRHAAAYLPGDARRSVRGFILGLPGRWASLTGGKSNNPADPQQTADAEAQKVLTLATESSNMLKGVQNIFTQTVESAERMGRVVGNPSSSLPVPQSTESSVNGATTNGLHHHHYQQQQPSQASSVNGQSEPDSSPTPRPKRRRRADPRGKGKGRAEDEMDISDGDTEGDHVNGPGEEWEEERRSTSPDRMDVDG